MTARMFFIAAKKPDWSAKRENVGGRERL